MKNLNSQRRKEMKLTQEDFDHIWLRFKDKARIWVFEWAAFLAIVASVLIYLNIENYLRSRADTQIQTLISSDNFKKEVLKSLEEKLTENNKTFSDLIQKNKNIYDELLARIKKIELLKNYPLKCYDNGIEFIDSDGNNVRLEFGHGTTKGFNHFKYSFKYPPHVFLTRNNSPGSPLYYNSKKTIILSTEAITNNYFTVKPDISSYSIIEFDWIAIGH
jgi:hypothetical protein